MKHTDKKISDKILEMLMRRDEMEHVRSVAKGLVKEGKIVITQAGQEVDPDDFKGAIRLRLK